MDLQNAVLARSPGVTVIFRSLVSAVGPSRSSPPRSTQVVDGHDMDHYADDLRAVVEHLDLKDAIHVGHSTGGGEVAHYVARHGEDRVAKAALISAVPPLMLQTDANPEGLPKSVFDGLQAELVENRSERRQGPLRRHRRLLADRPHRGPEEDPGAGAGDAQRS
jgi:pimeloyl-ACP methyl ester carboxylesterase